MRNRSAASGNSEGLRLFESERRDGISNVIVDPDLYEKYRVVINRAESSAWKASGRIRITRFPSRLPASYPFGLLQPKRNPTFFISYGVYFRFARHPGTIGKVTSSISWEQDKTPITKEICSRWQRFPPGFRPGKRRDYQPHDIDKRYHRRRGSDATERGNQPTRQEWPQCRDASRTVKDEAHCRASYARGEQFREIHRHPRELAVGEKASRRRHDKQYVPVFDQQKKVQRESQRTQVVQPNDRLPAEDIHQPSQRKVTSNRASVVREPS